MDDDKTQTAISKGHRAEQLLKNEAFLDACTSLTEDLMARWKLSKDQNERDRIWISVNLIDQVKSKLAWVVSHGGISRKKLDELTGAKAA